MKLTGAQILIECLLEQNVDTVFGYPGGTILNVYDALYDHREITHIPTSRARPTPRTVMPAAPARWVCALQPPAPAPRTSPPALPRHTWIPPR